jgi:hypothetical protein
MKKHYGLIDMINPTQIAVGYTEVAIKMEELARYEKEGTLEKYLKSKTIPCVLGPDNVIYITDHHHMGLALTVLANEWEKSNAKKDRLENPFVHCTFEILYDFSKSKLAKKDFFIVLESLDLLHPFDENGVKVENSIPRRLIDLKDDPYRSLAGFVRKTGGYNKVNSAYIEFQWADFFRDKITVEEMDKNLKKAVTKGVAIALSDESKHLPGFKGIEILKNYDKNFVEQIKAAKKATTVVAENIAHAQENHPIKKPIKFK